jgi:hypothetical protein
MNHVLFNPTRQRGAWRFGITNHRCQISSADFATFKVVLANAVAMENPHWRKGDWCEMSEVLVDQNNQDIWLRRCLGSNVSIANKKIKLLMKENSTHSEWNGYIMPDEAWYKIAILDTETNQIMLRSFHNIESIANKIYYIPTHEQENGWYFHGGQKNKRPSTVGADPTFWMRLNYVINH